ncbi:MAG: nucleoside-triphosphatase [Acholeplasmataceae bacterium]|nr:nucleoside-triphosphatase [Acholeplasmataceae bacterium]
MVTLIQGRMNAGKTTRLIEHYQRHLIGDGFAAIKLMAGNKVMAYDAMRLSDSSRCQLCVHGPNSGEVFVGGESIGPYLFSQDALDMIDEAIEQMIAKKTSPIYLDEIGMLELSGKGLDRSLKAVIKAGLDVVLTVRSDLVDKVIGHYGLSSVVMIDL